MEIMKVLPGDLSEEIVEEARRRLVPCAVGDVVSVAVPGGRGHDRSAVNGNAAVPSRVVDAVAFAVVPATPSTPLPSDSAAGTRSTPCAVAAPPPSRLAAASVAAPSRRRRLPSAAPPPRGSAAVRHGRRAGSSRPCAPAACSPPPSDLPSGSSGPSVQPPAWRAMWPPRVRHVSATWCAAPSPVRGLGPP
uniref:Uncharacterized protein n=1 Tax=Oryza sativa subsp. japonica TaxID=39947 RepID=Q6K1T4_ORYSJ|nr:hypothetical protein [Oryza sativa Japonica Group]